jgi:hypothetical protein
MRNMTTALAIGIAMLALSGCAAGPSAEDQFVAEVRAYLDTGFSDGELISLARDACDAVAAGGGQQAIQELAADSGMSASDYGGVLASGVTYFCPDQEEAFDAIFSG